MARLERLETSQAGKYFTLWVVALWREPPSRLTDTTQPSCWNFEGVYANSLDGVSDRD